MSDWTPHADAGVRAVPEDEAVQAVRNALEKRYRALVARLREAGDETWADNLSGYNSYRMEPAKCSLAVLEMMVEEIHQLRGRQVAIDDAVAQSRETGEPLVFVQSSALAEAETRAENERLRKIAREASEDVAKMRDRLDRYRFAMAREIEALAHERDQLKAINDRMAADRERLIAERDTYRDLAKELYDDEPCSFDHHGGCQAHGWLEPGPGEECPDGRAQRLFEGGNDDANDQA